MCRNLVRRAGLPAIVHDIDPEARAACVLERSVATADPGRVARECDVIFLSLPGAADVRLVCLGEDGLLAHARAGDIVVDCSTVPLALTRELAAAFAEKGASYVDAPVAGTVQSVADRSISLMVGADEGTFARLAPLLDCMAGTVQHCGESGTGTTTKLLLNMVIAQSVTALAEALLLGRRAGVDGEPPVRGLPERVRQLRAAPARHDGLVARLLSRRQVSDALHVEGPRLRHGTERDIGDDARGHGCDP